MPEPTDLTGAWIDHLRLLGVYERPIRIQALSRGELEAVALRLLANDPKRYKAQFEALLAKVDQILNQLGEAAVVAHETLEAELLDTR